MSEIERKILDSLGRNGRSTALMIAKDIGLDKATVNRHLYKLRTSKLLFSSDEKPPVWDLMEKTSEIKQILKSPEQTSLKSTGETCEEEDVRDLLRTGGLKAGQIAKKLGQPRKTVNNQLYSMIEKGTVHKCVKSNLWMLKDEDSNEGYNQESNHRLGSTAGLSQSFEVITKLGEGGFGWVYKVKHKFDGKIYAVKKVDLTGKADSEVRALARLDHPNIVRYITCWSDSENRTSNQVSNTSGSSSGGVIFERASGEEKNDDDDDDYDDDDDEDDDDDKDYDDDDDDDVTSGMESLRVTSDSSMYLFIQMEFCAGGTLTKWIRARNYMNTLILPSEVDKIFHEIVSGVEYIHSNKLIHRDLKPDNILFGTDGKVKIGDFGLVAAQSNHSGGAIKRSKRRGTPQYMSPEQDNKRNYDEKTDIFPLGLIWFEMLWKLSSGTERAELWPDLRNQIFPEGFCDGYPNETKFIKQMLSSTPEDRPRAEDIKKHLEMFFCMEQDLLEQRTV